MSGDGIEVETDFGKLTILVVRGTHPYVWIGEGEKFLDTINLSTLTAAARKKPKRAS